MSGSDPQDRAVLLLQRTRELMLECRVVAEQLAAATENASSAESGERIAYGVLVGALEEGLVNALQHAVIVLQKLQESRRRPRRGRAPRAGGAAHPGT